MTYNIHSGTDKFNKYSLDQILNTILESQADIVGLNEVVRNLMGSFKIRPHWSINQPAWFAKTTGFNSVFGKTLTLGPMNSFGNGCLTKYPIIKTLNYLLRGKLEQRGCLRVDVDTPKGIVTILTTHLGLSKEDRQMQIEDLVNIFKNIQGPLVLMGDFNTRNQQELLNLESNLLNTGIDSNSKIQGTYPIDKPRTQIDFIFYSRHFQKIKAQPILAFGSDHLPLLSVLQLE